MTELRNGDEVEIVRSKAQVPPAAWESMVVTGKARSAIRRATRAAVRKQYAGLGPPDPRARLRARQAGRFSDGLITAVLPRLAQQNLEDMLAAVGRGEIPSANVVRAVYPDLQGGAAGPREAQGRGRLVRPEARRRHEVPRSRPAPRSADRAPIASRSRHSHPRHAGRRCRCASATAARCLETVSSAS